MLVGKIELNWKNCLLAYVKCIIINYKLLSYMFAYNVFIFHMSNNECSKSIFAKISSPIILFMRPCKV